jgi:capsular polysaccharide biosynthesis protein
MFIISEVTLKKEHLVLSKNSSTKNQSFLLSIFPIFFPFGGLLIGFLNCHLHYLLTETNFLTQVKIVLKQYIEDFRNDFFRSLINTLFLGVSWFSDERKSRRGLFTLKIDNFAVDTQPAMCGLLSAKLGKNSRSRVLMVIRRGYLRLLIPQSKEILNYFIYSLVVEDISKRDISIRPYEDVFVIDNQFCFSRDMYERRTSPFELKFQGFPISGIVDYDGKRIMMRRNLELSIHLNRAFLPGYSHNPNNYYHFLIEVFPRILFWMKYEESREVPVLCDSESPWQIRELIQKMTGVSPLLVDKCQIYNFRELFLCEDFFHIKPVDVFDSHSENIFMDFIKDLTEARDKVYELSRDSFVGENCERVYIGRGSGYNRIPLNQERVVTRLEVDFGFCAHDFSTLSVFRQVEIMTCAKIVVAAAGAALTNLMFCNPGTKVIVQPGTPNGNLRRFWKDYANLFGLDYIELAPPNEKHADKVINFDEDGLFSYLNSIL